MPKVYDVVIPAHSGGGRYEIVSPNESYVKKLICSSLKKNKVPKGTLIKKIGLSKKAVSSGLEKDSKKQKPVEAVEIVDSLRARAKKLKKLKKNSVEIPIEKVIEKEKEELKKEKLLEEEEYYNYVGIKLRKDKMVTLKSKMDFSDCTLYILKDGEIQLLFVGGEAVVTLSRGNTFWLYLDHSADKKFLSELQNHI